MFPVAEDITDRRPPLKQSPKRGVAEIVTESIMASLESGVAPWRRPWTCGIPRSLATGKAYRGINAFILAHAPYSSPFWITRKQVETRGGTIRTDQKGKYWPAVFWKFSDREGTVDLSTHASARPRSSSRQTVLMRFYQIYNVDQCEGISAPSIGLDFVAIERAAEIVEGMPSRPPIDHGGDVACYFPQSDRVQMPPAARFRSAEAYYATLFHELGHSTGHVNRLARPGVSGHSLPPFGSPDYGREELTAELTAAFLCAEAGIDASTQATSAGYVASWLKALANDRREIIYAAQAAQRAADFVLGRAVAEVQPDAVNVVAEAA